VPRGEIRFAEPFVDDVRALMARGSCTIAEAVEHLATGAQDSAGVLRNVLFLIAGGALSPFACVHQVASDAPSRIASDVVERALTETADREQTRGVIPSAIYGNGVSMDATTARALLAWSRQPGRASIIDASALATYARLGLLA
jgi:hypothetical protein